MGFKWTSRRLSRSFSLVRPVYLLVRARSLGLKGKESNSVIGNLIIFQLRPRDTIVTAADLSCPCRY